MDKDKGKRRRAKDQFLPPFIGGPIDEIFLRGTPVRAAKPTLWKWESPASGQSKDVAAKLGKKGKNSCGIKLEAASLPAEDKYQRTLELQGVWVRVGDVPAYLFHLIYYFFTKLGTLETMRTYDEQAFFLLYKYPKDTLRALGFHRKRVIFLDQRVHLTCSIVKPSVMELIEEYHVAENKAKEEPIEPPANANPPCDEIFVYEDDYERECFEQYYTDTVNGNEWNEDDNDEEDNDDEPEDVAEVFYDISEREFANENNKLLLVSILLQPVVKELKIRLFRACEWAKMHLGAIFGRLYLTYAELANYVCYCLRP